MLNKSSEFVCISLSEEVLKVAQVKGSDINPKVSNVIAKDVRGLDETQLVKAISSSLSKFSVKSDNVVCTIPPSMVTTKNIEIPSVNEDEIRSIVNLQAGRHTPFSREEIQVGYINIGVFKNNYTKVLLVIANKSVLKKQLNVFEKANLKVKKVLFAPEGIGSFYYAALGTGGGSQAAGIIDIGQHSTEFIISLNGLAITTRNIPVGKSHISSEGDSAKTKLLDELSKTIESYRAEDIDQPPNEYIITTDDTITQELQTSIKEKLGGEVQIAPYINQIKAGKGVLNKLATDFADVSFLGSIASCANIEKAQVNLIPEEIELQKSIELQGKEVLKTAILAIIILFVVAMGLGMKIYFLNTKLMTMRKDYKPQREEVKMLEKRSNKIKVIQKYMESRTSSLDIINELYKSIPNEIYLTRVFVDEGGNIDLQGIANTSAHVYNWGPVLKESEAFKDVEIQSTTAKKDRGKDASSFEIALKYHTVLGTIVEDSGKKKKRRR